MKKYPLYTLLKDGKILFQGSETECYRWFHLRYSSSLHWAIKYEGFALVNLAEESKGLAIILALCELLQEDYTTKTRKDFFLSVIKSPQCQEEARVLV